MNHALTTRFRTLLATLFDHYRSLRHLRDRRVALLAGANLLNVMSVSIIVPLLPGYAERLGAGVVLIGLLFTLQTAARALLSTPFGWLSDQVGRRPFIVVGMCLGGLSVLGLGLVDELGALLALRALDGVASAMQTPATTASLGDATDEDTRGAVMGAYRTVGMIGLALGPALGGLLAGAFTPSTPFVVLGGLTLAGGVALGALLPSLEETPETAESSESSESSESTESGGEDGSAVGFSPSAVRANLTTTVAALSLWALVSAVGTRALDPLLARLLAETVGGGPSYVGFAWATFGLSMAICMPVGGSLADRVGRKRALVASDLLWAVVLFGLALTEVRIVPPLLLALGGVASALGAPALSALQYESAPEGNEGSLLGFYSTVFAIGGTAGPLLGGVVAGAVGVRATVALIGATWTLTAAIILLGVRDPVQSPDIDSPQASRNAP